MSFKHKPLNLINPAFDSNLTNLILELDFLKRKVLRGSTHPALFFQLKTIFHMVESIGSARIEGNNTTIAEYIETKIVGIKKKNASESYKEIQNVEKAMSYIDENIRKIDINKAFISDLHKMVVKGLNPHEEGDATPGIYRNHPVGIKNSMHIPPANDILINQYMEELFEFINKDDKPQFDLLKTAIAHHRFVWIHPFGNGNGRSVRLFTYAILVKQGFKVDMGQRILNPTAVFCSNRNKYYEMLSKADTGKPSGILDWCEYVLEGLKEEIEKIDKLLDYEFLKKEILHPALDFSIDRKFITQDEYKVLKIVVEKQEVQAADIKPVYGEKDPSIISRNIKKLISKEILVPLGEKSRKYTLRFENNYLIRGIINSLKDNGFVPDKKMMGDIGK
ncbi:MAG: Fic family protein [Chitinophagales bacterium]|nr:Fic family protein [Chitinophagales bacterium]